MKKKSWHRYVHLAICEENPESRESTFFAYPIDRRGKLTSERKWTAFPQSFTLVFSILQRTTVNGLKKVAQSGEANHIGTFEPEQRKKHYGVENLHIKGGYSKELPCAFPASRERSGIILQLGCKIPIRGHTGFCTCAVQTSSPSGMGGEWLRSKHRYIIRKEEGKFDSRQNYGTSISV